MTFGALASPISCNLEHPFSCIDNDNDNVLKINTTIIFLYSNSTWPMIGASGIVRGRKEFEPSSLAAESEPLLGPHLEGYWSHGGLLGPLWVIRPLPPRAHCFPLAHLTVTSRAMAGVRYLWVGR